MNKLMAVDYLKDYPFSMERQRNQLPIDLHTHEFAELVIVLGGKGVHFTRRESYDLSAGDCFLSPAVHGFKNPDHLHLANFLFLPDKLRIPWAEAEKLTCFHALFDFDPLSRKRRSFKNRLHLTPSELSRASGFIHRIERQMRFKIPGYEFLSTALFMELIAFLSQACAVREGNKIKAVQDFTKVLDFMNSRYAEAMKLEDLARMACMSVGRFIRAFNKTTGRTPIDYLIRLRIRKACELLYNTGLKVTDVAQETGFTDTNYFTRQFRRIMKVCPRDYMLKN